MTESSYKDLEVAKLNESPWNRRRRWNLGDLEASVKALRGQGHPSGILVPLHVRPRPGGNGAGWEILAGHRRYRVAKKLRLKQVPCIVTELSDELAIEVVIIDNLHHENVHPLDEAAGFKDLMSEAKLDAVEIARRVGMSDSYVYQRVKLLDLSEEGQELFSKDGMLIGHALQIARLLPEQQSQSLRYLGDPNQFQDWQASKPPAVKDLSRWIERTFHLDLHAAPFCKQDAKLVPEAGSCMDCPKRTGFQPLLFADVSKKDTCTDPACFHGKVEAHLVQQIAKAEEAGKPLVKVGASHDRRKAGVKPLGAWVEITGKPERCESVEKAILVDAGPRRGHTIEVCTNAKCKKHKDRMWGVASREEIGSRASVPNVDWKLRAELQKAEHQALIEAVLAQVPARPGLEDWRFLIAALVACQHDQFDDLEILKRHGATLDDDADEYGPLGTFPSYLSLIAAPAGPGKVYGLGVEALVEACAGYSGSSLTVGAVAQHFGVDETEVKRASLEKFQLEHPEFRPDDDADELAYAAEDDEGEE